MRRNVRIRGRAVPVLLLVTVIVCSGVGVTAALMSMGVIQLGYRITSTSAEAPTMMPSPLSLDLGSIPSGSSGIKEFSDVATVTLPVGYELTFTLDTTTITDFTAFDVVVEFWRPGDLLPAHLFHLSEKSYWNEASDIVDAGTYNVAVKVEYTAVIVTSETTGTVTIDVSYPG